MHGPHMCSVETVPLVVIRFVFFLATPCCLWDLSSLNRDQTRVLGSGSADS